MLFPRIAALAETAWNDASNKNIEQFDNRLKKHLLLYKENNIYYFNPFDIKEMCEPKE